MSLPIRDCGMGKDRLIMLQETYEVKTRNCFVLNRADLDEMLVGNVMHCFTYDEVLIDVLLKAWDFCIGKKYLGGGLVDFVRDR